MRGKRIKTLVIIVRPRNIPAHAGKTDGSDRAYTLSAEHPRACGENLRGMNAAIKKHGTSPRMRGKQLRRAGGDMGERNIPAYAGKT